MERRNADDWDGLKLENMAKHYMAMRREIWSPLAAQTGEKWNVVEAKVLVLPFLPSLPLLSYTNTPSACHRVSKTSKPLHDPVPAENAS
jgi:hypothetical protein